MSVAELTAKRRLFAAASAGHWLDRERLRVYSVAALVCYAIYFGIWCVRAEVLKVAGVFPPGGDFVVFWSAAKLTLQGNALAAYDIATLHQLEVATVPLIATNQAVLPWFYPPTFLLFVAPFGLLPYWLAVPVFFGVSAAAFVWVVRRIVPWREAWLPSVAFPGIAVVLATGQNALLLAACGGLALTMLRARPVVAGMLLALLTLKPQLALMVPVALVCARAWRALAAMTLTTLALAAAALGAFGIEAYAAFLHNAGFARSVVESGAVILARMPTIFALVKMLHGGVAPPVRVCIAGQCVARRHAARQRLPVRLRPRVPRPGDRLVRHPCVAPRLVARRARTAGPALAAAHGRHAVDQNDRLPVDAGHLAACPHADRTPHPS
jgi:energy-converting hydrogenase Eha subunit A